MNDDNLDLGELTLTLCYLPAAGRLTVTVVKAINLKSMDINGKSDPYVKISGIGQAVKTNVINNNLNPIWNETFHFFVDVANPNPKLLLQVFDSDLNSDDFLGL